MQPWHSGKAGHCGVNDPGHSTFSGQIKEVAVVESESEKKSRLLKHLLAQV